MSLQTFSITSELHVPAAKVLASLTMRNVNRELRPLVAMTAPSEWVDRRITEWPVGQWLVQSWGLLFGIIPIDRHIFFFQEIDPSNGFEEVSRTWINKEWRHERTVVSTPKGCRVIDRVSYRSRIPFLGAFMKEIYRWIFYWRHRRMRALLAT